MPAVSAVKLLGMSGRLCESDMSLLRATMVGRSNMCLENRSIWGRTYDIPFWPLVDPDQEDSEHSWDRDPL
jgi:hypothetical protein